MLCWSFYLTHEFACWLFLRKNIYRLRCLSLYFPFSSRSIGKRATISCWVNVINMDSGIEITSIAWKARPLWSWLVSSTVLFCSVAKCGLFNGWHSFEGKVLICHLFFSFHHAFLFLWKKIFFFLLPLVLHHEDSNGGLPPICTFPPEKRWYKMSGVK